MPFQKGQSGNPNGRPKKSRELENLIREALEVGEGINLAVERLLYELEFGESNEAMQSIKLLLAYGYGRPPQHLRLTGADGGPIQTRDLSKWTDEDLENARRLAGKLADDSGD